MTNLNGTPHAHTAIATPATLESLDVVRQFALRSRAAWNLTEAEAEVAADITLGHSPTRIAASRGVSVHTVRTQLKRVLAKSGCHRQIELAVRIRSL